MNKFKNAAKNFIAKHGTSIAAFAFAFVAIAANSSCVIPYFGPEEPKGLKKFKKFDN